MEETIVFLWESKISSNVISGILETTTRKLKEDIQNKGIDLSNAYAKDLFEEFSLIKSAVSGDTFDDDIVDNMLSPKALLPLFDKLLTEWRDRIYELWKSHGGSVSDLENTEENTSNIDQLINSTTWSEIYESSFFPASKAVEEDELAQISTLRRRFNRTARSAVQVFQKEVENESKMFATLDSHLNSVLNRKLAEGKYRGPELLSAQEMDRKLVARRWLALFNQLTQERGIWLPKKARNSKQYSGAHWKLDRVENRMRMHRRLMRNFEFDDHSEASIRRDKSHQDKDPQPADLSISQLSISEQKRVTAEKLRYHMKLGASNDELRQVSSSIGNLHVTESELAEEDWSVLTSDEMGFADAENFLFSCECEMIMLMTAIRGRLELTSRNLTFFADLKATASGLSESDQRTLALIAESEVLLREKRWPISKLREVYFRRYKLRNSAVEFFFLDGSNYFFNFLTTSPKMRLVSCIIRLRPENLKIADVRAPTEMIAKSGLTERWMKHEISNFEYLMHLNTISGRTHNDLTQYPVFPWVLTDYKSAEIDLSDPSIYRDLSKPIGALDPVRLEQYVQRYEAFEDPNGSIKKFMYGTHYSTAAAVLYYLLRLEPFTSLHIALQGGKFDHPDRQFDGIQSCWSSVLTGNGDVKELIPEFFYMPEFLVNENKFDLGTKQTGARLDDVHLPPWAATPEDFIRIHREALESDYVSNHLHEWIDLIWGYKQTGPESVKAHNVFYYLTYEGNINIDEIEDPVERRSIEDQINNFGQTPTQLFKKPHPKRGQSPDCLQQKIYDIKGNYQSTVLPVSDVKSGSKICFISTTCKKSWRSQKTSGLKMLGPSEREKIVLIDSELMLGTHKWNSGAHNDASVGFEPDTTSLARRQVIAWDVVWGNEISIKQETRRIFYGHDEEVTCVSVSADQDLVVSGSKDGTCIVHALGSSQYIRTLIPSVTNTPFDTRLYHFTVVKVLITQIGIVVLSEDRGSILQTAEFQGDSQEIYINGKDSCAYSGSNTKRSHLNVFSLNGKILQTKVFVDPVHLNDVVASEDGCNLLLSVSQPLVGTEEGPNKNKSAHEIIIEQVQAHDLSRVIKKTNFNFFENQRIAKSVLHVASNEEVAFFGSQSDKLFVFSNK
ncbi:Neurobeachin-like protein 1 [Entophlyctis luteolus]|nr:Neurobeachin-like protein 1 [Entophlyctis luteolus]